MKLALTPEVPVLVLHVFGEFGDQQVSAGIEDALADHSLAFPLGDHVAGIENLSDPRIALLIVLYIDQVDRKTLPGAFEVFLRQPS
jgi:hypothetical protein